MRVDAQYMNDNGVPADSAPADRCNDRDFGMSRFLSGFIPIDTSLPAGKKGSKKADHLIKSVHTD
jgi:hypothetical protein